MSRLRAKQLGIGLALAIVVGSGAWAQASGHNHGGAHPTLSRAQENASPGASASGRGDASAAPLVAGVVRRVDREAGKVTLRHGPIPNLEMPEMTMVFQVADPAMLEGLEAATAIRFRAERRNGQLTLTYIEAT